MSSNNEEIVYQIDGFVHFDRRDFSAGTYFSPVPVRSSREQRLVHWFHNPSIHIGRTRSQYGTSCWPFPGNPTGEFKQIGIRVRDSLVPGKRYVIPWKTFHDWPSELIAMDAATAVDRVQIRFDRAIGHGNDHRTWNTSSEYWVDMIEIVNAPPILEPGYEYTILTKKSTMWPEAVNIGDRFKVVRKGDDNVIEIQFLRPEVAPAVRRGQPGRWLIDGSAADDVEQK